MRTKRRIPYLIQRHRAYYFRIRVPKELRDHPLLASKEFIYKPLKTDSLSMAIKRRDIELAKIDALINGESTFDAIVQTPLSASDVEPQPSLITLKQALELTLEVQRSKVSVSTLNGYKNATSKLLKSLKVTDTPLSDISTLKIDHYISVLKGNLSDKTINNQLNYLSTVFKVAKRKGLIRGDNPFTNSGLSNEPTNPRLPYSKSQVVAIHNRLPIHLRLAWKILYYTGMRRSELFKLTQDSIVELESETGLIKCFNVAPQGDGKTKNATRYIPIHPELIEDLEDFNGFDFSPNTLGAYRRKVVRSLYGELFAKSHDTHSLRHTFSTTLHNHFPDQPQLVDWLTGHTRSIRSESFQTYFHGYGLDRLYKAVKSIPSMN